MSAKLVGQPLSFLFAIIKIEHGGYGIHTDSIHMELPNPVKYISDQEVLHFVFAQIENLGAPVGMLSTSWIRILKNAGSVKLSQSKLIRGKMSR